VRDADRPTRPLALVTGASSGIGRDLARHLARAGCDLVLVARSEDALDELAVELRARDGAAVACWPCDLAEPGSRTRLIRQLERLGQPVDVLVNNAGFGVHGRFERTDLARELEMIEVNVAALVHLTKAVLPAMRAQGSGRILHVASVGSFVPGPLLAVYYATKAFVLSFGEALAEELAGTGVTVTTVCPGPTVTGFHRAAGLRPDAPTVGAPPMSSDDVARIACEAMFDGRRVVIPGARNRFLVAAQRFLPRTLLARAVRRLQERRLA
jgi:short-subunit dehydrogenase